MEDIGIAMRIEGKAAASGRDRYGGLSSRELWFWLSTLESVGVVSINRLLGIFGSPEGIWEAELRPRIGGASARSNRHHIDNVGGMEQNTGLAQDGGMAQNTGLAQDCGMAQNIGLRQGVSSASYIKSQHDENCGLPFVGLRQKQLDEIKKSKLEPERIAGRLRALEQEGICFIGRGDAGFPDKLRCLPDCPTGLFVKGRLPPTDMPLVAIVGARGCDEYGRQMAEYFGTECARHGIGVISGMAVGIDGESQRAALRSGGYSMAILGCGVDICYPKSNYNLYGQLIRDGGVVSENPPGTIPQAFRFPMRNRLVSAFSDAVLVVEARERSGSLITVDHALEQGRDVMAVPGRAKDLLSEGCNRLIRQGAALVTCFEDVCEVLGIESPKAGSQGRAFDEENGDFDESWERVLFTLSSSPSHVDIISEKTGMAIPELMHALLCMEMRGLVRQVSQGQYVKQLFSRQ